MGIWTTISRGWAFTAAAIIIILPLFQEVSAILKQLKKNKKEGRMDDKSERGVDAAVAAEEQQRDGLEADHQVKHWLQNHQQASRLVREQLFTIKLIIVLINLINSRLKIIDIVVSKHTIS